MSDNTFGTLARAAAIACDRRLSLTALGAMTVLAASQPFTAKAGKAARKTCKRQVGQCLAFFDDERCAAFSSAPEEVEECLARFGPCCNPFAKCNAVKVVRCLGIGGT